jgi:hypothetical protein
MKKPTKIVYKEMYSDSSGVEFSVTYEERRQGAEITLHHLHDVTFPIETLDWLIDKLQRIRAEIEVPDQ